MGCVQIGVWRCVTVVVAVDGVPLVEVVVAKGVLVSWEREEGVWGIRGMREWEEPLMLNSTWGRDTNTGDVGRKARDGERRRNIVDGKGKTRGR